MGQSVEPGDEVPLLESMEIPVLAKEPGTITDVRVQPGDVVQEGDVLVVIDWAVDRSSLAQCAQVVGSAVTMPVLPSRSIRSRSAVVFTVCACFAGRPSSP